jgi:hypothetical protein
MKSLAEVSGINNPTNSKVEIKYSLNTDANAKDIMSAILEGKQPEGLIKATPVVTTESGLGFINDPKLRNMLEGYKPEFMQSAGDYRLPEGYAPPFKDMSTEVSASVGGEDGEPAYLIPTFKYGKRLENPMEEFNKTGQHLGGPFKTWQDAEKFQEIRHQYVEKGKPLPSPIATSNINKK